MKWQHKPEKNLGSIGAGHSGFFGSGNRLPGFSAGPGRPRPHGIGLAKTFDNVVGWNLTEGAVRHISIVELLRPLNCLMASVGVFVGFSVANGAMAFTLPLMLGMISAFLITGAGNLINDFFDIEIDRKQWSKTPLTRGDISPIIAFAASMMLFVAGILVAFFTTQAAFLTAILASLMLILYSAAMQGHKYIGNVVVAAGTALTLIFGAGLVGNYLWASVFAFSAFLANIGREITKDIEDLEKDRGSKRTLPMLISFAWVSRIVFSVYAVAIIVAGTAWSSGIVGGWLFIVLLMASTITFFVSWENFTGKNFRDSQKLSKYAMAISLAAFLSVVI
ncbi:Digeranylgeranylglyceryl phosphate synthase [uncultured archaeon]|nr:Digeranylgeranylglyceryl phosphate synthase [uncultured archaeon]